MVMLNIPISAIDRNGDLIAERVDFSQPMPKGNYSVVAKEAEIKRNQKDTTNYLRVAFQVIAGPWKGKWVARHFMLWMPDAHALENLRTGEPDPELVDRAKKNQEKAEKLLAAFCRQIGIPDMLEDTDHLLNKPVVVFIDTNKGSNGYPDKDEIYAFRTEEPDTSTWTPPEPVKELDDDVPF